jgi:hypothetical protein
VLGNTFASQVRRVPFVAYLLRCPRRVALRLERFVCELGGFAGALAELAAEDGGRLSWQAGGLADVGGDVAEGVDGALCSPMTRRIDVDAPRQERRHQEERQRNSEAC